MLFKCTPVELDFIAVAPLSFENSVEVDASADAVFDILADVNSWPRWFSGMTKVVWNGKAKGGVGAQRTISLMGLVKVKETFLEWQPGKRFCFRFERQNALLARAAVEDIHLTDLGDGRCRVDYNVYMELPRPLSPLALLLKPVLGTIFKRGAEGLKTYVQR